VLRRSEWPVQGEKCKCNREEECLEIKIVSGNEALAYGALQAGVKVVTGYPGTPSTGALTSLLAMGLADRHVEWSVNEKVAFEIAAGAAWAGQRALCTMKMSGLNVAYDSVISIAYSGVNGGLVIYVADDPGSSAGMAEQDTRGFALMSDLPMIEPSSVRDAYRLTQVAFELSERVKTPVFVRLVASISDARAAVEVEYPSPPTERTPILEKDIAKYTKAGSKISMSQHKDVIARLEKASQLIDEMGLNSLQLAEQAGGLGILAVGVTAAYLEEAFDLATEYGFDRTDVSVLHTATTIPFPAAAVRRLLAHCNVILVLEELEPYLERGLYIEAHRAGFTGRIVGKLEGPLSRIGEYDVDQILRGLDAALGLGIPETCLEGVAKAETLAAQRPINVCPGCPHRGTYMAINRARRRLKLKKNEVMVTGDIGCTILGMNPPFNTVWTEVSMGASVSLAQGYVYGGVTTPVIATIGDSTFFHAGIPGLLNAIQHQLPLTLVIMDNGWTSMTGMQVNPGTEESLQPPGGHRIDLAQMIPRLGVDQFFIVDPYDLEETTAAIEKCLTLPGVKVVLARQECAIQAMRRGEQAGYIHLDPEKCTLCNLCIIATGCPALSIEAETIAIDPDLCNGCGLCATACPTRALWKEEGA
jgi:indolepyruvate ferredoxin oxidoreductase alpha subunit